MIVPVWAKYLAILAVAGGIYAKGYSDGKEAEQNRWLKQEVVAVEAKRAREVEMQAQVDASAVALSMSQAEIERLRNQTRVETRNYYHANPAANVACLGADRLRSVEEADKAAYAAATASTGAK